MNFRINTDAIANELDKFFNQMNSMMLNTASGELPQSIKICIMEYYVKEWIEHFKDDKQMLETLQLSREFVQSIINNNTTKTELNGIGTKEERERQIEDFRGKHGL